MWIYQSAQRLWLFISISFSSSHSDSKCIVVSASIGKHVPPAIFFIIDQLP